MDTLAPIISKIMEPDLLEGQCYDTAQCISSVNLLHFGSSAERGGQGSDAGLRPRLRSAGVCPLTKGPSERWYIQSQLVFFPANLDEDPGSRTTEALFLALHLRLQLIHLHLLALALGLRLLDLLLQPLDLAIYEVEAAFDGHDGFAALLFQEDGADELVDGGGGGEGGEFLLDAFVLLLLGLEALAGGDGCLEVCLDLLIGV